MKIYSVKTKNPDWQSESPAYVPQFEYYVARATDDDHLQQIITEFFDENAKMCGFMSATHSYNLPMREQVIVETHEIQPDEVVGEQLPWWSIYTVSFDAPPFRTHVNMWGSNSPSYQCMNCRNVVADIIENSHSVN